MACRIHADSSSVPVDKRFDPANRPRSLPIDRTEFANGLLTELRKTGRHEPSPADTTPRETPAQIPFPTTRQHQKNGK